MMFRFISTNKNTSTGNYQGPKFWIIHILECLSVDVLNTSFTGRVSVVYLVLKKTFTEFHCSTSSHGLFTKNYYL